MIELADSLAPAAEVATQQGPTALVMAAILYVARGVPKLVTMLQTWLGEAIVATRRTNRVLGLAEKWLAPRVENPRESDEVELYRLVNDGATDEELGAVLEEMDPGETLPRKLGVNGDRLLRISREITKRRREASGPKRAAQ